MVKRNPPAIPAAKPAIPTTKPPAKPGTPAPTPTPTRVMGAPLKYTPDIGKAVCECVSKGVPEGVAAQAAGVCKQTLSRWKHQHPDFCENIKKARAASVAARVERIEKAAHGGEEYQSKVTIRTFKDGSTLKTIEKKKVPPQWQADAWWLERQQCEEFGLNRLDLKELLKLLRASKKNAEEPPHG